MGPAAVGRDGLDEPVARVRDRRHPRVGDEDDPLAGADVLSQDRRPLALVVLVIA